ncbi:MAG: FAD-dependent oxidoreductase, partial [Planctomycetota bacterium]|nr:FAD-dependent oxidoreductase [Planctomycetota bacterium]
MLDSLKAGVPGMSRRYLADFELSRIAHRFTDVLVIGSGIAGLSAALAAAGDENLEVLVLAKDSLEESATRWAQGGIAAVLLPERTGDSLDAHIEDTIQVAAGLSDEENLKILVTEGVERVRELLELGTKFDRGGDGDLQLTREGAHSFDRILHRGDTTGQEIARSLIAAASGQKNIFCRPGSFAVDLLDREGSCIGALTANKAGDLEAIWARQTILATGGAGRLYRETTNPAVATGDGLAMGFRAGAELMDLEFIQFHPTTLYLAGADRFLITE